MPAIDLSILNQRQTPAFFADVFANRPPAGFVGRVFISTDTFIIYRDNGTSWNIIGGGGAGAVTGSGANGQVSFWNGASTISGSNGLFWDNVNGHLGIGTVTPGTALQIDHNQNQIIRLNQTTATNDTKIAFQNSGTALWRIGNSYNAGANDFGIFDIVGSIQPITIKKISGNCLLGGTVDNGARLQVSGTTSTTNLNVIQTSTTSDIIATASIFQPLTLRRATSSVGAAVEVPFQFLNSLSAYETYSHIRSFITANTSGAVSGGLRFTTTIAGVQVQSLELANTGEATFIGNTNIGGILTVTGNASVGSEMYRPSMNSFLRINGGGSGIDGAAVTLFGSTHPTAPGRININSVGSGSMILSSGGSDRLTILSTGVATFRNRLNALNATDNALFDFNVNGSIYCAGFSPNQIVYATNQTLTRTNSTAISTGNNLTFTLPSASGINNIFVIKHNGTGTLTVTTSQTIVNMVGSSVTSIVLTVGQCIFLQANGNNVYFQLV